MRRIAAITTAAAMLLAASCGEEKDYPNRARPTTPIVLSASINGAAVSVYPRRFGAGPVTLVITNQTAAAQQITFRTEGRVRRGFDQQTGPINPGDTATLKADVPRGRAVVKVLSDGIAPARLSVGAPRPNAANELLQP